MSNAREAFGIECPEGGKFYICEDDSTPFIGCCANDPCGHNDGTCPDVDLRITSFNSSTYEDLPTQDCDNSQGIDNCTSSPSDGDSSLSTGATAGIAVGAGVGGLFIIIMVAWLFWWRPRQKKKVAYQKPGMVANQPPDTPGAFPHQQTFAMQSPAVSYQQTFPGSPAPGHQYPSGIPMDQYQKFSPQSSPYDRPQSYAQFSDIGSVTSPSPGLPAYNSVYSTPQPQMMAPVSEMDGTSSAPLEMSTGQEHQISGTNSPQPEKGR
ncbi:hypothetical protein FDECE_4295 [Fusarium decemcellulare]|nr:hypothetical protein FDECE_4295 [Fusarium decemcellulare]